MCLSPTGTQEKWAESERLGIAGAALDELGSLPATKTPNYTTRALRDRDATHAVMGRSRGITNGARAYFHQSVAAMYDVRPILAWGLAR